MHGSGHGFKFIDPIKIKLNRINQNQQKNLELFGLILNTGTQSVGMTSVEIISVGTS